ncbi:MAG: 4-hydroxy-3-methylbut-2-enyl diphosphate reductase [Alphaproteobacteria bacterium]
MTTSQPNLTIRLASPRGFCAGVDRAIEIVEKALERYGAPVYVRHEIVHNRFVVDRLAELGAVFVEELEECPEDRPVIFSAHGVPKSVPEEAKRRQMFFLDATCPLVSKVHREAERHHSQGRHVLLIGHEGHPEVVGTLGQLPSGSMTLVETVSDAETIEPPKGAELAFASQTTLSVNDTAEIISILQRRFPDIAAPKQEDICYATTNRQAAVKAAAEDTDLFLIVGASNSSNSNRLVEVALLSGARNSHLIAAANDIDWQWLEGVQTVGLSAGASAPEQLVDEVVDALKSRFNISIEEINVAEETTRFKLPRELVL